MGKFKCLFSRNVYLNHVNVALENFAFPDGIRKYLLDKATSIGVRGLVRRVVYHQVFVRFEGTLQQISQFQAELEKLKDSAVCKSLDTSYDVELINGHVLKNFEIRQNERRQCFKNPNSDGAKWEKLSSSISSDSDYMEGRY
jgi:hypothetical protein